MELSFKDFLLKIEQLTFALNEEKTPFKTKYEAWDLLKLKIEKLIQSPQQDPQNNPVPTSEQLQIYICNSLASKLALETLEPNQSRLHLLQCENLVNPISMSIENIVNIVKNKPLILQFMILAFNTKVLNLGNSQRYDDAKKFWVSTEQIYKEASRACQDNTNSESMYYYDESKMSVRATQFQYIHSMFFAAQVYTQLNQQKQAADLCMRTIQAQLAAGGFDRFEIIKNGVDLSRYFTQNDLFSDAYNIFKTVKQVAEGMTSNLKKSKGKFIENKEDLNELDSIEKPEDNDILELQLPETDEEALKQFSENDKEQYYSLYWELGGFYVQLVRHLKLINAEIQTQDNDMQIQELLDQLSDKTQVQEQKIKLSFQFLQDIIDQGHQNLQKSLIFFLLDGHTSSFCKIQLLVSELYDLTANFQPFNTIQLQKQRITLFEQLQKDLNPQHYSEILEDIMVHLSDAKHQIFDFSYKKMLQRNARFEQQNAQLSTQEQQEIKKLASLAAVAIEQFQTLIQQTEQCAQTKCKCQENLKIDVELTWEQWVKWIHEVSLEVYLDAIFKQASIFSKFPTREAVVRKRMMECALQKFEYCEKMWKYCKEKHKMEVDENLKLVAEMMVLMKVRISQIHVEDDQE